MYVTDISLWRDVGAVHAEVFGDVGPVATMVEVSALISPELWWRSRSTRTSTAPNRPMLYGATARAVRTVRSHPAGTA